MSDAPSGRARPLGDHGSGGDGDDAGEPAARTITLTRSPDDLFDHDARRELADGPGSRGGGAPVGAGPTGDLFPPHLTAPRSRRWRLAALAVAGVVAVTAVVVWSMGNRSSPSSDAAVAAVTAAARHTVAATTAVTSSSMTVDLPGSGVLHASGLGAVDFARGVSRVDFTLSGVGGLQGDHLREVFVGPTIDLSLPQLDTLVPGKPWVSEPLAPAALVAPRNADLVAVLGLVASGHDRVTDLGPATVAGRAVEGYRVTIRPADAPRSPATSHLPAPVVVAAQRTIGTSADTVVVDVDTATGSIRRVVAGVQLTLGGRSVVARVTSELRAGGRRVHLATPAAGQVLTLRQLQAAVRHGVPAVST